MLRSDYGTENASLASIQIAFRYYHDDGLAREKSFVYGPSKSNIVSCLVLLLYPCHVHLLMLCVYSASKDGGPNFEGGKRNGGSLYAKYNSND